MLRKVLLLSSGSALGKLLGIVREILLASFFGTSAVADAYRAVMTIVLAPVHLLASEPLNASFIPQFSNKFKLKKAEAWSLFNGFGILLVLTSLVAAAVLYFLSTKLITVLLPGFVGESFDLAVQMIKIMAIGLPFCVVSMLMIALGAGRGRYTAAALRPFVQNLGMIIAILAAFYASQPVWITWGFPGTYVAFTISAVVLMTVTGTLERGWYLCIENIVPVTRRFLRTLKPIAIYSIIVQANLLLEKAIASLIAPGSVASIDYAKLVPETALLLFIAPLGMVSLSEMSTLGKEEVSERSDNISAITLMLTVPLSAFVLINAPDIIGLLFGRGAFDEYSQHTTSMALRGMSVGLWAFCLSYVLLRIYNARFRNSEVLRIAATALLCNALFNIVAYRTLGVLAIGLGFSLYGIISSLFFVRGMREMERMRQIAWICLFAVLPYMGIAIILTYFELSSILSLMMQMCWVMVFWGGVFFIHPVSRIMVKLFVSKITSLKGGNS